MRIELFDSAGSSSGFMEIPSPKIYADAESGPLISFQNYAFELRKATCDAGVKWRQPGTDQYCCGRTAKEIAVFSILKPLEGGELSDTLSYTYIPLCSECAYEFSAADGRNVGFINLRQLLDSPRYYVPESEVQIINPDPTLQASAQARVLMRMTRRWYDTLDSILKDGAPVHAKDVSAKVGSSVDSCRIQLVRFTQAGLFRVERHGPVGKLLFFPTVKEVPCYVVN